MITCYPMSVWRDLFGNYHFSSYVVWCESRMPKSFGRTTNAAAISLAEVIRGRAGRHTTVFCQQEEEFYEFCRDNRALCSPAVEETFIHFVAYCVEKRSPPLAVSTIQTRILALRAHRVQCPVLPRAAVKGAIISRNSIARSAVDRWLKENTTAAPTPTAVRLRTMWRLLEPRPTAADFRPQDRSNKRISGRSREDQYRLLYYVCLATGNRAENVRMIKRMSFSEDGTELIVAFTRRKVLSNVTCRYHFDWSHEPPADIERMIRQPPPYWELKVDNIASALLQWIKQKARALGIDSQVNTTKAPRRRMSSHLTKFVKSGEISKEKYALLMDHSISRAYQSYSATV